MMADTRDPDSQTAGMKSPEDAMHHALGETDPSDPDYDPGDPDYDLAAAVARAVSPLTGATSYSSCAEHAAQRLLAAASRDPEAFAAAAEKYREDPYGEDLDNLLTRQDRHAIFEGRHGITGFQWGWAVNAVFFLTGQDAGPNPAIVPIRRKTEMGS